MPAEIILSVCAMTAIIALRYLATSGLFAWLTGKAFPGLYIGLSSQIRSEIGWSVRSAAIYAVPAGIVAWGWRELGWSQIYVQWGDYPLWYLPVSLLAYLFLHDSWFYWTHRWMHRPRWFRIAHQVHHASKRPTAWTAMSFHPVEAVTGAVVIPALVLVIPIHIAMLACVLAIMTLMGITNHMGWEIFPRWLVYSRAGNWLITASHHQRHHEYYPCNYGLYFRFWDRLCGTDNGLSDRLARPL